MEQRITVFARIRAKQGMEERVRESLLALIGPTLEESGCIDYELHQAVHDKTLFMFYENWTSEDALAVHAKQPHLTHFRETTAELLAEPALIEVFRKIGG